MRNKGVILLVLASALTTLFFPFTAAEQGVSEFQRPYPQGVQFPLGLYSIHTVEEMKGAGRCTVSISECAGKGMER